jgi:hypothetical protein
MATLGSQNRKMNSIRIKVAIASCFTLILLSYCALVQAQDIKYNFAQGTDFSKYKTYKWFDIKDAQYPDQITPTR